jgi:hypothetical protein
MVFEGVENSTFRGYVLFHTARVAWEARAFEMGVVPKAWKRRAVEVQVKVPRTLRGTLHNSLHTPHIPPQLHLLSHLPYHPDCGLQGLADPHSNTETVDINIHTLTPLLPPWPHTFSDLNAARDHVRQCCYAMHFRYMYFPSEERVRFRTIVQFSTAKYAHRRGEFVLAAQRERVGGTRGAGNGCVKRDSGVEKENGGGGAEKVSTAPYSLKRDGKVVSETWEEFRKRVELAVRAGSEMTPPLSASDGGETIVDGAEVVKTEEDGGEVKEITEEKSEKIEVKTEEKPTEAIDPFKVRPAFPNMRMRLTLISQALIADLRRVSVLKAAFE